MIETDVDDFLAHYGVKGQRWGVRKNSSTSTKSAPKKLVRRNPLDKTKHLSNDELRKVVDRLRLDQQYTELSRPKATKGKKFAQSVLEGSGKAAIGAFVGAATTIAVSKVFKK